MSTIATKSSSNKVQIPIGNYLGRCISSIHLGTTSYEYMGDTKTSNKVRFTFELPTELKIFKEGTEPKPLVISREYNLSTHEKSDLRKMLEAWRGKAFTDEEAEAFDVEKIVGIAGMINVLHNDKGYAEIASISNLPKGFECPTQINPTTILSYDNWNEDIFNTLPSFIQDKMKASVEYKKLKGIELLDTEDQSLEAVADDDYPVNDLGISPF